MLQRTTKEELDHLESSGIITKVYESEWATPIVCVLKPNGALRLCADYSVTLNKSITTVKYPLPSIEEVIGQMGNAKIFSKLDLQNAYLQLPLSEESKLFTTINTSEGMYV